MGAFAIVGALFVSWLLFPLAFPVRGIWKRDDEDEYIELEQFGPFVSGKRNVDGGNHMYSGFQSFFFVGLKRRDFGIPSLIAQGFPEAIAKKINGSVTARLRLWRSQGKLLVGSFRPQRILFDETTTRVMSRHYDRKSQRRFARTNLNELPQGKVEVKRTGLPPPDVAPKKRKRTF